MLYLNLDDLASIEFLWVGSQLTPGTGRVAADPGVGSQLTPVPQVGTFAGSHVSLEGWWLDDCFGS